MARRLFQKFYYPPSCFIDRLTLAPRRWFLRMFFIDFLYFWQRTIIRSTISGAPRFSRSGGSFRSIDADECRTGARKNPVKSGGFIHWNGGLGSSNLSTRFGYRVYCVLQITDGLQYVDVELNFCIRGSDRVTHAPLIRG